jgi:hypothetical protein
MFDVASFLAGFIMATLLGRIFQRIYRLWNTMNSPNLPLDKFPDAAHPSLTARGIVSTANQAFLWLLWYWFLLIVMIAVDGLIIWYWSTTFCFVLFGTVICPS